RVRLGKPVFAEAQDLLVDLPRERFRKSACAHAVDQPLLELLESALPPPCGHRAAQLIGFSRRKSRGDDRELHNLLLEDRHAERAFEHAFYSVTGISDRLETLPPLEVRMHHSALDRTGPDDRD